MSEGSSISSDAVSKPTRFCRKCSYVLDGLDSNRCPECGRAFDATNKRTFRRRPRRRLLMIMSRIAAVLLLLLSVAGGWLYHVYCTQQAAMNWAMSNNGMLSTDPYGPVWLTDWMVEHNLPVIDTVVSLGFDRRLESDALRGLNRFTYLYELNIVRSNVTDADLVHVKHLRLLGRLDLSESDITDSGLVHLSGINALTELHLSSTDVTGVGL